MPLTFKPMPSRIGVKPVDGYSAHSGGLLVGYLRRTIHSDNTPMWTWSLSILMGSGYEGPTSGSVADLYVARRQLYDAWRAFLPWADLAEADVSGIR